MWLLNALTLKLHAFLDKTPDYVILSHTWGEGEISFDDIDKPHAKAMAGYDKIVGCCRQAVLDGFVWAWIDTCCIDKRSSAELSEAINSMYKWYWQAAICYVYLSDVSDSSRWRHQLKTSRWFTRGWTLQELLAPDAIEFYNKAWIPLGTRTRLVDQIQQITKIEQKFFLDRELIKDASISTKFSWAARRKTTRVEDMAYCMLGLVQVNMPMLYGEGERAFYRLQLEIIRQTNEHSIFAWQPLPNDWQVTAVLAPSPAFFEHAAHITPTQSRKTVDTMTHEVTNNGLRVTLPSIPIGQDRVIALLDCRDHTGSTVGIWLEGIGNGKYQRLSGSRLVALSEGEEEDAELLTMFLVVDNESQESVHSAPHRLVLGAILTDRHCRIRSLTVTNQHTVALGVNVMPAGYASNESMNDKTKYVLEELVLEEGEAACVQLGYKYVVFGLRNGRPAIKFVTDEEAFRRHWSEEMRMNPSGEWDFASDYIEKRDYDQQVTQVEAKKRRHKGILQWTLTVKNFYCACRTATTNNDACVCHLSTMRLRAVKSDHD